MGGRARIVLYAPNEQAAQDAALAAFDRIAYLEDVMSDFRPTSELNHLCAQAGGTSVKVSPELLFVLTKSRELARRSDGAFDPTVGPLVRLWRTARKSGTLPSQEKINAAKKLVGWHKMAIDSKAGTIQLKVPGMQLDLGGIAKGYACDEAIRVLKDKGIRSALVEMGGDIVVSGPPPGKKGWEIAIPNVEGDSSRRSDFPVYRMVSRDGCTFALLANAGISSSGDTEQFVEINGVRYSHIVDPKTGLGLMNRIAVTIIAPNGTTSDGLSTAVSVLGEKRGKTLTNTFPGVSAYIRKASE